MARTLIEFPCSSPPSPRRTYFFSFDQKRTKIFSGCRVTDGGIEEKSSEGGDEEEDEADKKEERREGETRK